MGTTYISMSATNYVVHAVAAFVTGVAVGVTSAYILSQVKGTKMSDEIMLQASKKNDSALEAVGF
jgi:hypothetical protein